MTLPEAVTLKEFARIARRKPSYITQLKAAGRLVMADDGKRVLVAPSLALIEATRDPSRAGVAARHEAARAAPARSDDDVEGDGGGEAASPPAAPPDAHSARRSRFLADKAEWDAKAAERDYRVSMGRLLEADQVVAAVATAASRLRVRLETLPYDLAPQLAPLTDEGEVRTLLAEEIEAALAELSRQFADLTREATE